MTKAEQVFAAMRNECPVCGIKMWQVYSWYLVKGKEVMKQTWSCANPQCQDLDVVRKS